MSLLGNWIDDSPLQISNVRFSIPLVLKSGSLEVLVISNNCVVEESFVVLDWHVESTIPGVLCMSECFQCICSPGLGILIGPGSLVSLRSPWVSDLNKLDTFVFSNSKSGKSVIIDQTLLVSTSHNCTSHDVLLFLPLTDFLPELILSISCVHDIVYWNSSKGRE